MSPLRWCGGEGDTPQRIERIDPIRLVRPPHVNASSIRSANSATRSSNSVTFMAIKMAACMRFDDVLLTDDFTRGRLTWRWFYSE